MNVSEAQRLKVVEDENRCLQLLMAELSLHGEALKAVIRKRLELAGLRGDVAFVSSKFRLSERTACKLLGVERSSYRYEPRPDRNASLREELVKLALVADTSLGSGRVTRVLERLIAERGRPHSVRPGNGPECTSRRMPVWGGGCQDLNNQV